METRYECIKTMKQSMFISYEIETYLSTRHLTLRIDG